METAETLVQDTALRTEMAGPTLDGRLKLNLEVTDPEVTAELAKWKEGPERDGYAFTALRLGVLTLQQARGELDAQAIRRAGEHLVAEVRSQGPAP